MKKEYIKGYFLDEEDVGCERYPVCFTCPFKRCSTLDKKIDDAKKQKERERYKRYYQQHREERKEKNRQWREKQRLAKLLDKQREDAEREKE